MTRSSNVFGVLNDGTAVIRKDFVGEYDDGTNPPNRTVDGYVEPGKTTGDLPVRLVDDKVKEPTETFTRQACRRWTGARDQAPDSPARRRRITDDD